MRDYCCHTVSFIINAFEKSANFPFKTRLSPERSFYMSLTREKVYPVHELMEDCELEEDVPYLTPSFTNIIQPRYKNLYKFLQIN